MRYLTELPSVPATTGRAFDIGGPDVMSYAEMMRAVAAVEGRHCWIVPVPLLTPGLSARWLRLITDVDADTGRSLIDSMAMSRLVGPGMTGQIPVIVATG